MNVDPLGARRHAAALLAAISLIVIGLGSIVLYDLRQTADTANQLYARLAAGVQLIGELEFQTQESRRIVLYALHTVDANRQIEYVDLSRAADLKVRRLLSDRPAPLSAPDTERQLRRVTAAWDRYVDVREEVIGFVLEGSMAEGVELDQTRGAARFDALRAALNELAATFRTDAAASVAQAQARAIAAAGRLVVLVASALVAVALGMHLINRRTALERLLASEAHKGRILQAVPDPVISTDAGLRIIEFNDAAARVFAVPRAEALGAALETLVVPARGRRALVGLLNAGAAASGAAIPTTALQGRRRSGEEFPMELAAVSHRAGGRLIWTLHIADVSAWRHSEEQLRAARDAAEAADRAKGEFLATMSHELRTPLTAVIGAATLLQGEPPRAEQVRLLRTLRSSATSLLALVSDILDYSRVEAGFIELTPVAFELVDCIEEALDQITEAAAGKGLAVGYVIDPRLPRRIVADEGRVRQVLLNLLSNAVKFSDAGDIAVHARGEVRDDGVLIELAVRDSGRGIPAELMPRLFRRFSQLRPDGGGAGGVGLGLAISRGLSQLLGGTLTVASREGEGSTFVFTFAAALARDEPARPPATPTERHPLSPAASAADAAADAAPPERADRAVAALLVEDHDASRDVLRMMLEELGVTVDEASSGVAALERARSRSYDVILMDVHLPRCDGLETTRRLRETMRDHGPAIIAITAAATPRDQRRCREAGMDAFLQKPVRLDDLASVIRRVLAAPGR